MIEGEERTLEPKLDDESLRVLTAIPECGDGDEHGRTHAGGRGPHRTLWQIGEALDRLDLRDLSLTVNGLVHLGWAREGRSGKRREMRTVYWRSRKGDAAVAPDEMPETMALEVD